MEIKTQHGFSLKKKITKESKKLSALNNGETVKFPDHLGEGGEQSDHITDTHQLVTKTKEGAVKMKRFIKILGLSSPYS